MAEFAVKRIDDMEAIYGGAFKRARAELGIESFGIQVFDMPAKAHEYPEHDHAEDGQEEVYIALSGGCGSRSTPRQWSGSARAPSASCGRGTTGCEC